MLFFLDLVYCLWMLTNSCLCRMRRILHVIGYTLLFLCFTICLILVIRLCFFLLSIIIYDLRLYSILQGRRLELEMVQLIFLFNIWSICSWRTCYDCSSRSLNNLVYLYPIGGFSRIWLLILLCFSVLSGWLSRRSICDNNLHTSFASWSLLWTSWSVMFGGAGASEFFSWENCFIEFILGVFSCLRSHFGCILTRTGHLRIVIRCLVDFSAAVLW